jgi:PPE-repeat protein
MNFATLPPEINSGRMCAGPGSGSMTEAAAAWDKLAARLYARLADYRSVTSKLAQACRATPYLEWLEATAARAAHAATQAETAASAFESAVAAMVPPPVIAANRAERISLASANCLGQGGPAIADTEADYDRMWVRDAQAMNTYAGACAEAAVVAPFSSPAATAGPAGEGVTVIWAGQQVMSAIPQALQAFSSSPLTTVDASLSAVTSPLSKLSSLTAPSDVALTHLSSLNKAAALQTAAVLRRLITKPSVTAGFGRVASVGALSVPQAWAKAALAVAVEPQPGWVCEPIHLVHVGEPPS